VSSQSFVQVFINVGTRDGFREADVQKLLTQLGLPPDDIRGIRVRDRMSFVGVRKAQLARVTATLSGQVIGGRRLVAELARAR
jgi:ATP-dependent RNA helicase DeaD